MMPSIFPFPSGWFFFLKKKKTSPKDDQKDPELTTRKRRHQQGERGAEKRERVCVRDRRVVSAGNSKRQPVMCVDLTCQAHCCPFVLFSATRRSPSNHPLLPLGGACAKSCWVQNILLILSGRRLYHCGYWREERNTMPNMVRSSLNDSEVIKRRSEVSYAVRVVSKVRQTWKSSKSWNIRNGCQTLRGNGTEKWKAPVNTTAKDGSSK